MFSIALACMCQAATGPAATVYPATGQQCGGPMTSTASWLGGSTGHASGPVASEHAPHAHGDVAAGNADNYGHRL